VLITFHVNPDVSTNTTPINLAASNAPSGLTVTTYVESSSQFFPLRPAVTNASNDTGVDGSVAITGAHFVISTPSSSSAGSSFSMTVSAKNALGNTVTDYSGTVHITSTDSSGSVVLPANYTFVSGDSGVHTFTNGVTLVTAGNQTVTATDTVSNTGTSGAITINALAANHLAFSVPSTVTAGTAFSGTVTAEDQFNNTATGYTGTVAFQTTYPTVPGIVLPGNYTFVTGDHGTKTFSSAVILNQAGGQYIWVTDSVNSFTTNDAITVTPGALNRFQITAPSFATAGVAVSITVMALDAYGNIETGYTGTVHFTSTDALATLPANSTLSSGYEVFSVTLDTNAAQTVTGTDTVFSSIVGTTGTINVS
jgi:hypothetical protein